MARISPVHYKRLVCVFTKDGFIYDRTRGDHLMYVKPGIVRTLVIPMWDTVPLFIIQSLLRTAKMNRKRYFELLAQC